MKSLHIFSVERLSDAWIVTFGEGFGARSRAFTDWDEMVAEMKDYAFITHYFGGKKSISERGP